MDEWLLFLGLPFPLGLLSFQLDVLADQMESHLHHPDDFSKSVLAQSQKVVILKNNEHFPFLCYIPLLSQKVYNFARCMHTAFKLP